MGTSIVEKVKALACLYITLVRFSDYNVTQGVWIFSEALSKFYLSKSDSCKYSNVLYGSIVMEVQ